MGSPGLIRRRLTPDNFFLNVNRKNGIHRSIPRNMLGNRHYLNIPTTTNQQLKVLKKSLWYMVEQLENLGVQFNHKVLDSLAPDSTGTSHKPWVHPPFNAGVVKPRDELKGSGIRGIPPRTIVRPSDLKF